MCLAHVTRPEKKKRDWVLCLARTNDVPVYVKIYLLKKTDKDNFKKKQEWQLRDLKILDGVSAESPEIRMDLDERQDTLIVNKTLNLTIRFHLAGIPGLWRVCRKNNLLLR